VPSVVVLQLHPSDPPGPLVDWLGEAGVEVDVREDVPASLAGVDGLVVLGGPQNANDDELAPVRALLRGAVTDEVPTLAICLGAQLLAAAHGGRVEPNSDGPEIGAQLIAKRTAASTDPLFGPRPITPDVLQWHFDAVTVLPPGAVQLASSPMCAQQAFRLGRLAWGIQFHIETTPDVVRDWARDDAPLLPELDLDLIVSRADAAHADIAEVWAPFVHDFAGIVRDPGAVPAARGVATSIAEPVTDPAAIRAALAAEMTAARQPLPMPAVGPPGDG
jgi:GMP synthase-like glutamine amidotransferase